MGLDTEIIPSVRQVIYTTYAAFPTTGLTIGDLGWATDRQCLYRWSGSAWENISISSRHGNYADIGDPANYPESSLYQADDQEKLYMVVSGAWDLITQLPTELTLTPIASDDLKNSNDGEKYTTSTSYVKLKEVKINAAYSGVMRIKFDLKGSGTPINLQGRLYKNGVAIGTEQTHTTSSYATYTEDLTLTLVANDLLQIYVKRTSGTNAYVCNMRFLYRNRLTEIGGNTLITTIECAKAAISTTNQDP